MKSTKKFKAPKPHPWGGSTSAIGAATVDASAEAHACSDCIAPCCWNVLFDPAEGFDIEEMVEYLSYEGVVVVLELGSVPSLSIVSLCRLFDRASCGCSVHSTEEQPEVCRVFESYACWYRKVWRPRPGKSVRLDFNAWISSDRVVTFDAEGKVTALPTLNAEPHPRQEATVPGMLELVLEPFDDSVDVPPAHYLYYFSNFHAVQVARTHEEWQLILRANRYADAIAADDEDDEGHGSNGVERVVLDGADIWALIKAGHLDFPSWEPARFVLEE